MNHWKETADILERLAELQAAGRRAALATVVDIVGSAYRRPGAKLLIEDAGGTLGSVSGGCLEADVREVAKEVVATGRPSLRHYDTGDDGVVWGLGLGCNGLVEILVQPATAGPLAGLAGTLRELFAGDGALVLATIVAGAPGGASMAVTGPAGLAEPGAGATGEEGAVLAIEGGRLHGTLGSPELDRRVAERAGALLGHGAGRSGLSATGSRSGVAAIAGRSGAPEIACRSGVHEIAGRRVFLEVLPPPPHLLICGAGDDARALVAYAADVGFRVTLIDHRPALLAAEWFPRAWRRVLARPDDPDLALPPAARSLAVVKTHSLAHDREWVRRLLGAGLPYVGVLGPRARTAAILRDVGEGGEASGAGAAARASQAAAEESDRERVFGPVGLDLGADGPWQVAISIVAELLAFIAGREPRHLSLRQEAIHAG